MEKLGGNYLSVGNQEEFVREIKKMAVPPPFNTDTVKIELIRLGIAKKLMLTEKTECLCHFNRVKTIYVCTICESPLCP